MSSSASDDTVSVCIPVYNGAEHLDAAIWTARRQTLSPFEIVVVDDGSTDASVRIAERHASEDRRVRVIVNDANLGMTGNWQRAVDASTGRWIKFLFQDDLLDVACVERLIAGVQVSGAVMGFCARRLQVDGLSERQRRSIASIDRRNLGRLLQTSMYLDPGAVAELALQYWSINVIGEPTSALVRRDVFDTFGTFDAELTQLCDWEYWIRVGIHQGLWYEVEPLATFRVHPAGATFGNRTEREIWTVFGERALLGWKFLCGPEFQPIRDVAAATEPSVDLRQRVARQLFRFDMRTGRARDGHAAALAAMERRCGALPLLSLRATLVERTWRRLPVWIRAPMKRLRDARERVRRDSWGPLAEP